jgi:hypothetical protein
MNQKIINIIKEITFGVLIALFLFSCKNKDSHEYHNIMEKIEAESEHYEAPEISSEEYNRDIKTVKIREGRLEFLIPERKSQIASYNCTECHSEPLEKLKQDQYGKKAAHWDVKLVHAGREIMNCTSCHDENNMDDLRSLTNRKIDLNYSYKLCSQCHQKEFKDWKGGAHGKQLGGWANPRVSNTCVNCHDPHKPNFEKRWPVRYNTQKVIERQ